MQGTCNSNKLYQAVHKVHVMLRKTAQVQKSQLIVKNKKCSFIIIMYDNQTHLYLECVIYCSCKMIFTLEKKKSSYKKHKTSFSHTKLTQIGQYV